MASFFDKENSSQLSVFPQMRGMGPVSAPVGKVFQANSSGPALQPTPARSFGPKNFFNNQGATPRRALGDVKNTVTPGGNRLGGGSLKKPALKLPAPASKPPKPRQQERQKLTWKKPESHIHPAPHAFIESVEKMDVYQDPEDDYEDIWASRDRPATYIQQLKDWRPSRLLPAHNSEQDDKDWERQLLEEDEDEEELISRVANLTVEEPYFEVESPIPAHDFLPMDHIPLPPIDDLFCLDNMVFGQLE